MGACDGPRRIEPVAPAVGDRPSIGDETRFRQSDGPHGARAAEQAQAPRVTPVRGSTLPDSPLRQDKLWTRTIGTWPWLTTRNPAPRPLRGGPPPGCPAQGTRGQQAGSASRELAGYFFLFR